MTADLLRVEAPSDAMLRVIPVMCRERGFTPPVIASQQEAKAIFDALKDGTYDPDNYTYDPVWGWVRDDEQPF